MGAGLEPQNQIRADIPMPDYPWNIACVMRPASGKSPGAGRGAWDFSFRNSKELSLVNLVEEFIAVRIGLKVFTMRTGQSQMLEHRNQKGDLPREKSGGFGRGRKFRGC